MEEGCWVWVWVSRGAAAAHLQDHCGVLSANSPPLLSTAPGAHGAGVDSIPCPVSVAHDEPVSRLAWRWLWASCKAKEETSIPSAPTPAWFLHHRSSVQHPLLSPALFPMAQPR